MTKTSDSIISTLPGGVMRPKDMATLGISRVQIQRLTERGELVRLGRGLYCTPDTPMTEAHSLAEVAARVPNGVICLLSALEFHHLTTQSPWQVWLMLPRHVHAPRITYPPVAVVHAYGAAFSEGIEEHPVEGVTLRVTSLAKTVVDCFRYRNRVGQEVALEALREAVRTRRVSVGEIGEMARRCQLGTVMHPYLEMIAEAYAL